MSVYRGKIIGPHGQDPDHLVWVLVPQVSGVNSQLAQKPKHLNFVSEDTVWIAYEAGDFSRPVVLGPG